MNVGFKGCHPAVNMLFYISVLVFGMMFSHPVCLAVSLAASLAYYLKIKGRSAAKTFCCYLLPMLLIVVIINSIFSHYGVTVLTTLPGGNNLTFEAIINGVVTGFVVVSVILWFFTYNEVVTADKFMFIFGKIIPQIALIISMALRFVPMYGNRLKEIADAQRGIGKDYRQGNITERIKNGSAIIVILVTWALENAIETADSMRARGYGLKGRRTYTRFIWQSSDTVNIIILILIDILLISGAVFGTLKCFYNPMITINPSSDFGVSYFINELNLTVNPLSAFGYAVLSAYILLCFLPIIIDLKEDIKWHSLKSKI